MTSDEFRRRLLSTLGDGKLSRGERQALAAALHSDLPDETARADYRRTAFDIARTASATAPRPTDVLHWLEDVLQLLDAPPATAGPACRGDVCFSPGEACRDRIAGMFRTARRCVDICVFTITDDVIAEAILDAHVRDVALRIITDDQKSLDLGSDVARFESRGIPVRVDRTRHHMHHKFAIFDRERLVTGSYNWTLGAARDNEEHVVILGEPQLVARFQAEFERMWRAYQ